MVYLTFSNNFSLSEIHSEIKKIHVCFHDYRTYSYKSSYTKRKEDTGEFNAQGLKEII